MVIPEINQYRNNLRASASATAALEHYALKTHDDDVILSLESFKEYTRLIQRQGINNLTILSVTDELLADSNGVFGTEQTGKYRNVLTRDGNNVEFLWDEIKDKQGYFVIVRYSFAWENGWYNSTITNNEHSGRHKFVKDISTIVLAPITQINNNGTFDATIDQTKYIIRLRGFDENGKYTGAFNPSQGTDKFLRGDGSWTNTLENTLNTNHLYPRADATYDLGNNDGNNKKRWKNLYLSGSATIGSNASVGGSFAVSSTATFSAPVVINTNLQANNTFPKTTNTYDLGTSALKWRYAYATTFIGTLDGTAGHAVHSGSATYSTSCAQATHSASAGYATSCSNATYAANAGSVGSSGTTGQFWRGDNQWSNTLTGGLTLNGSLSVSTNNASGGGIILSDDGDIVDLNDGYCAMRFSYGVRIHSGNRTGGAVITLGSNGNISASKVYNAVFNDYAECRTTIDLSPGHVVADNDDGSLRCTEERLIPGAQIISDTYGNLMGETDDAKTPIAVAGRVLVYTYQPRENYHAGMSVCSAPGGTVDIMTREEIRDYPDCIIGIVSEIPDYEYWGSDNVKVDNRIWIKVR